MPIQSCWVNEPCVILWEQKENSCLSVQLDFTVTCVVWWGRTFGIWKHFDTRPTAIVYGQSISYGSELVEHEHVNTFPHDVPDNLFPDNVPDYQSLLINQVIRATGLFHIFSMKGLFWEVYYLWPPDGSLWAINSLSFIIQSFLNKFYIILLCFRISVSK